MRYTKESLEAWYTDAMQQVEAEWQEELRKADMHKRELASQIKDEYTRKLRKLEAEKGE